MYRIIFNSTVSSGLCINTEITFFKAQKKGLVCPATSGRHIDNLIQKIWNQAMHKCVNISPVSMEHFSELRSWQVGFASPLVV